MRKGKIILIIKGAEHPFTGQAINITIDHVEEDSAGIHYHLTKNGVRSSEVATMPSDPTKYQELLYEALKKLMEAGEHIEFWYTR